MDPINVQRVLDRNRRYVAFIDVLGYRSIVSSTLPEASKFARLHSLFEALGVAVETSSADCNRNLSPAAPEYIHGVGFSDSFYFAVQDLPALLRFLESLFAVTYGFQQHTYDKETGSWVPFIRAGVAYGWVVNFRDVTMTPLPDFAIFRNPIGPAVAEAYVLTERTGRLPGMRCFMSRSLLEGAEAKQVANPKHYQIETPLRKLRLLDVPPGDSAIKNLDLLEVAWPCRVIDSDNCSFHEPLSAVRYQFGGEDAFKHYNGTVELFERSIAICEDSVAKQVWDEHGRRICMPLPNQSR